MCENNIEVSSIDMTSELHTPFITFQNPINAFTDNKKTDNS